MFPTGESFSTFADVLAIVLPYFANFSPGEN
jgi:hypothetical protein